MGNTSPFFKSAVVSEILNSITTGDSNYYLFASHPMSWGGSPPSLTEDDYTKLFQTTWSMIFGKKLTAADVVPMARYIQWVANTQYDEYDNTDANLASKDYYVVVDPDVTGGYYHAFKVIDNANGAYSTQKPDQRQSTPFTKSDDYIWRYVCSVSTANWLRFATDDYFPVYPNSVIQASACTYSGIDKVVITNGGNGYSVYTNGTVRFVNSSCVQLDVDDSQALNYYTNSGIYIYNDGESDGQLRQVANSTGRYVYFNTINTAPVTIGTTQYIISPMVVFDTNGNSDPVAYTTINATGNSINSVVIVDRGYGITRANVSIISNSSFGSNVAAYVVVPPPGGHGANPAFELQVNAIGIATSFINSESNSIYVDVPYNKIGILRNPYTLNANGSKGSAFTSNHFKQAIRATLSSGETFEVGSNVTGNTTNSIATVAFCNSSVVWLVGDKTFQTGEYIYDSSGNTSTISINTLGDIFQNDIIPLYSQNITDVNRTSNTAESFKLVIEI